MVFLILAVLSSASVALLLRQSGEKTHNEDGVFASNYFMATLVAVGGVLLRVYKDHVQLAALMDLKLVGLSAVAGLLFYLSLVLYRKSILKSGAALSSAFARMGIILPVGLSMFLLNEHPKSLQLMGGFLTLCGIFYFYFPEIKNGLKNGTKGSGMALILLALMLISGISDFMNKIFQQNFPMTMRESFLGFGFLTAMLLSGVAALRKGDFSKADVGMGFKLGLPNILSSLFIILALKNNLASVVFPIYSAATIGTVAIGGWVFFKEQIKVRTGITLVMLTIAIILMNL